MSPPTPWYQVSEESKNFVVPNTFLFFVFICDFDTYFVLVFLPFRKIPLFERKSPLFVLRRFFLDSRTSLSTSDHRRGTEGSGAKRRFCATKIYLYLQTVELLTASTAAEVTPHPCVCCLHFYQNPHPLRLPFPYVLSLFFRSLKILQTTLPSSSN